MGKMTSLQDTEQVHAAFRALHDRSAVQEPAWLSDLRRSALGSFAARGLPTIHDEDWRYTSVEPIRSADFGVPNGEAGSVKSADLDERSFTDGTDNRIVFINGVYSADHSSVLDKRDKVRVESIKTAIKSPQSSHLIVEPHLSHYARYQEQPFVALNTAFAQDGALVVIPRNAVIEKPIYLLFLSSGETRPIASYPRNLVVFESGSQARVVESFFGIGEQSYFVNVVTEIVGAEDALIDYYRVQREQDTGYHIGTVEAHLGRNCNFTAHSVTVSGALVRNDLHVALDGEGAECTLNGLYLLDRKQHVDNQTVIEHFKERTASHELYKGIIAGGAHAVFNGKILVHKDAQKTDARQTNKNLLLSENAVVNTKPQLEIHADDVKCSHGSTIGQLDKDALFYLRSRGLDLSDAQSLLSYAFASELVGRMKIEGLKSRLDDFLLTKFRRS
jgi:Fe-S cluster assembly protein SufD